MKVKSEVIRSCLTLSDTTDCSLPGSLAHGIFQARGLEWGAIAFSICRSDAEAAEVGLFYEDLPEKAMAPPLQHFCLENPMDGGAW